MSVDIKEMIMIWIVSMISILKPKIDHYLEDFHLTLWTIQSITPTWVKTSIIVWDNLVPLDSILPIDLLPEPVNSLRDQLDLHMTGTLNLLWNSMKSSSCSKLSSNNFRSKSNWKNKGRTWVSRMISIC